MCKPQNNKLQEPIANAVPVAKPAASMSKEELLLIIQTSDSEIAKLEARLAELKEEEEVEANMQAPLPQVHRSPLNHKLCFTLLCGTIDRDSKLHSLRHNVHVVSMIVHLAFQKPARELSLDQVASNGGTEQLEALIHLTDVDIQSHENWRGSTALHMAAYNGHTEVVRLLLQCGGDPNMADKHHWTAVHMAAYNGHTEALRLLLQSQGDPNKVASNPTGGAWDWDHGASPGTALTMATANGHTEALQLLLQNEESNWNEIELALRDASSRTMELALLRQTNWYSYINRRF